MIKELTEAQKTKIPEYIEKWIKIGTDTSSADRAKAEGCIVKIYERLKLAKPTFYWYDSPVACCKFISEDKGQPFSLDSNFLSNQNDVGWLAFYDFFEKECGVQYEEKEFFETFKELAQSAYWWWPFENAVVISEKPVVCKLNSNRQLHCADGPAIAFKDGLEVYALNGVRVPKEIVTTPAEQLDPNLVLSERNAEVRREIVRKIGVDRVMSKLNAKVVDSWKDYEFFCLDFKDGRKWYYLKMRNPSVPGVYHLEGIHPDIPKKFEKDEKLSFKKGELCQASLAWRNGQEDDFEYEAPVMLT